ncbi:MAG: HlyD family secretion protein [Minwuiales bacterium]|nr:HlyD family secretion protein [Minwuiales bacterium]
MAERRRYLLRFLLLFVVPAIGLVVAAYIYTATGRYISTDNAYVKSQKVAISSDIDGRVTTVTVRDNEFVRAGQQLFQIDPSPFQIALDEAKAEIADVKRRIDGLRADYRQAQAELKEAEARLRYMDQQVARYRDLSSKGISTAAKFEEVERDRASAAEGAIAIQERMNKVLVSLGGRIDTPVEEHPWFLRAKAEKERAALNLSYTLVVAPIDGVVSNMKLEEGEYVEEGEPVFIVIEQNRPWVEANLKETQLTHIVEGQEVSFVVDAYPSVKWRGVVESISPATGAEFSILPPQNASGNWVKVVQRIPVRIDIEPDVNAPPLRAGMTATVSIDTERQRDLISLYNSALAFVRKDEQ